MRAQVNARVHVPETEGRCSLARCKCMRARVHVHVGECMRARVHVHVGVRVCVRGARVRACARACVRACLHACMHTCTR